MRIVNPFFDLEQSITGLAGRANAVFQANTDFGKAPHRYIGPSDPTYFTRQAFEGQRDIFREKRAVFPYRAFRKNLTVLEALHGLMVTEYKLKELKPEYGEAIDKQIAHESRLFRIIAGQSLQAVPDLEKIIVHHEGEGGIINFEFPGLKERMGNLWMAHHDLQEEADWGLLAKTEENQPNLLQDVVRWRVSFVTNANDMADTWLNHACQLFKNAVLTHQGILENYSKDDADEDDWRDCVRRTDLILSGLKETQNSLKRTLADTFEMGALQPGPFIAETYAPAKISVPLAQFGLDLPAGPVAK